MLGLDRIGRMAWLVLSVLATLLVSGQAFDFYQSYYQQPYYGKQYNYYKPKYYDDGYGDKHRIGEWS